MRLFIQAHAAYVCGEGAAQELLSFSLLGFSGVASVLEVLESGPQVLNIVLQLIHSSDGKATKEILF